MRAGGGSTKEFAFRLSLPFVNELLCISIGQMLNKLGSGLGGRKSDKVSITNIGFRLPFQIVNVYIISIGQMLKKFRTEEELSETLPV